MNCIVYAARQQSELLESIRGVLPIKLANKQYGFQFVWWPEAQRVILARALYRRPKLLVLDEATSHLDIERERQVNTAVSRMQVTRIVIVHRPETIASAQRVLAVADGAVQSIPSRPHDMEVAE